jgi:hypothetical protein
MLLSRYSMNVKLQNRRDGALVEIQPPHQLRGQIDHSRPIGLQLFSGFSPERPHHVKRFAPALATAKNPAEPSRFLIIGKPSALRFSLSGWGVHPILTMPKAWPAPTLYPRSGVMVAE